MNNTIWLVITLNHLCRLTTSSVEDLNICCKLKRNQLIHIALHHNE